jgi:hypothetical protein
VSAFGTVRRILVVIVISALANSAAAAGAATIVAAPPAASAVGSVSAGDGVIASRDSSSLRTVRLEAVARTAVAVKAEREAAAVAAVAQADAAAQAQARAAAGFVTRVWTSGFQDQINQCRGAVDVTAVYKVHVIAEHSNCGGSSFPTAPGAIVTVTGLDAGRYRVIGIVAHLNGLVNHAEDIPRGYELLFQTCAAGFTDMRFIALARVA